MFYGQHNFSVDSKGRISIPARFRDQLKESETKQLTVTRGLDGCLFAFTAGRWAELEEKLLSLPLSSKKARFLARYVLGAASVCTINEQGRINIPPSLLVEASITKEVIIIGVGDRIEIWSKELFERYEAENIDYLADLEEIGI